MFKRRDGVCDCVAQVAAAVVLHRLVSSSPKVLHHAIVQGWAQICQDLVASNCCEGGETSALLSQCLGAVVDMCRKNS